MNGALAGVDVPPVSHTARDRLFWAAIVSGAVSGLLFATVALRMSLVVLDRQIALPDWASEVWYHVGNLSDAGAFTVVYVVVPVIWFALSVWWWFKRSATWQRGRAVIVAALVVAASLPGIWAWFASALWLAKRVLDLKGISRDLIYSRFTDTNYWSAAVVVGLAWLSVLILGNILAMARKTAP